MQRAEGTPQPATPMRETAGNPHPQKSPEKDASPEDTVQVSMTVHEHEVNLFTYPSRDSQFFADSPQMKRIEERAWLPVPGADF
ncbi:MAG TPA: hypothetical protein VJB96_05710 [Patescibacteria group bacterium]|nr:hypothetical protein [Patescibacteria group bacterium]